MKKLEMLLVEIEKIILKSDALLQEASKDESWKWAMDEMSGKTNALFCESQTLIHSIADMIRKEIHAPPQSGSQYEYEIKIKPNDSRLLELLAAGFSNSQSMYLMKLLLRVGCIKSWGR